MFPCAHDRGCPHGVVCESCDRWLPKDRTSFPWGSRKPKICDTCIDEEFRYMLGELNIDFAGIEEQMNGCI